MKIERELVSGLRACSVQERTFQAFDGAGLTMMIEQRHLISKAHFV